MTTRLAILISGSGTNMVALAERIESTDDLAVGLVLSDRPGAGGLDRANEMGLRTEVVAWSGHADRTAFTEAVCDRVEAAGCTLVVLAGFMRILSPPAIARFPDAILNVHPSLLPAFPGAHAVEDALAAGVRETGVTVHLVDEWVDHGPVLAQEAVPVRPDDTAALLHRRIQRVEHRLYPEVVVRYARGEDFGAGREQP